MREYAAKSLGSKYSEQLHILLCGYLKQCNCRQTTNTRRISKQIPQILFYLRSSRDRKSFSSGKDEPRVRSDVSVTGREASRMAWSGRQKTRKCEAKKNRKCSDLDAPAR